MRKLLRAGFSYIRMMKTFWIGIIVLIGYGLLIMIGNYEMAVEYDRQASMPQFFAESLFQHVTFIGIIAAVFNSLFVGMEYSDGTVRNKLVVGQSRTKIYLTNFINCAVSGMLQVSAASAVIWAAGGLLMGKPQIGAGQFLWACVIMLFLCMSYAAIYNFCSMMISSRSYASILNVLLAAAFLLAAAYLLSKLSIPEMTQPSPYILIGEEGAVMEAGKEAEAVPNPYYVSGLRRDVYQFLIDFLPGGQSIQMADFSFLKEMLERPFLPCIYSAVLTAALNLAGIALFRRKDIK